MKNTYQIIEGVGDPTGPKEMEYARFLDITFTNERHAYEFAWSRYWQTINGLTNWKSYWSHVTTCTTIENALAEVIQQMKVQTQ
jgi:hypothetical protein